MAAAAAVTFESRLKSAESALSFVQGEHRKVLGGLHQEIRRLQQKNADLQFALTSVQGSAKAEKDLRAQLQELQEESEQQTARAAALESKLREKTRRLEELEEQSRWRELDLKNQLENKDAKIRQLQSSAAATAEATRLQGQCKKLYEESEAESRLKAEAVARRAKTPATSRSKHDSDDEVAVQQPVIRSLPSPSSTRSKVFRHKLQRSLSKNSSSSVDQDAFPEDGVTAISFSSARQRGNGKRQPNLPLDYRARVSTLPPILAARSNSVVPQGNVVELENRRSSLDPARLVAAVGSGVLADDEHDGSVEVNVLMSDAGKTSRRKGSGGNDRGGRGNDRASPAFGAIS